METHGLDTEKQVFFYEQEFYVLSNFSAFAVEWKGRMWMTSEHAYHSEKFLRGDVKDRICEARSAHDALKIAHAHKQHYREDWNAVKMKIMEDILRAKVAQHPYVKKKLLETGDRELIENSWRDDFWGWGSNCDGANHLGKLWMKIRDDIHNEGH